MTTAETAPPAPATAEEPRSPRAGALVLAAGALAAAIAVYVVFVRTRWGQEHDENPLLGRWTRVESPLSRFQEGLDVLTWGVAAAGAAALAVILVRGRRPEAVIAAVVVIAGANATTQAAKAVLPRPEIIGDYAEMSLPSGHTTAVTSLLMAVVVLAPPAWRAAAAMAAGAGAGAEGVGVVAAGWHRPSDSVAAILVCLAWAALVAAILARPGPPAVPRPAPAVVAGRVSLMMLVVVALALGGARAAADGVSAIGSLESPDRVFLPDALLVATCAAAATALLAAACARRPLPAPRGG